ncbi:MAG: hypothetical protein PWP04_1745 [Candidatus Atribacteria bacterium]|nr:hypothetical protein [Candidatus Atribacteria bacterium]
MTADRARIAQLIQEVIDSLPPELKANLQNVDFVLEEEPDPGLRKRGLGQNLLGLYQGIPLPKRGRGYSFVLPDKITLYTKNIQRVTSDQKTWEEKVKEVVLHEIGHYFGLNEAEIQALWKKM